MCEAQGSCGSIRNGSRAQEASTKKEKSKSISLICISCIVVCICIYRILLTTEVPSTNKHDTPAFACCPCFASYATQFTYAASKPKIMIIVALPCCCIFWPSALRKPEARVPYSRAPCPHSTEYSKQGSYSRPRARVVNMSYVFSRNTEVRN